MIVPSTKHAGDTGKYYLSVYFSTTDNAEELEGEFYDKEKTRPVYKNFEIKYINPTSLDEDKYKEWKVIAEEDESSVKFPEEFLKALSTKANEVVFNEDEEA